MRHVKYNPNNLTYPANWNNNATTALNAVQNANPDNRSDLVNQNRNIWSVLKPELANIFHKKCWYTEAPQAGTDTDVDHFRPKNAVKGCEDVATHQKHPGYWWLAFDPNNYRFSCIFANRKRRDIETGKSGGKADEFPVVDEANRAWRPADDLTLEQPILLDPCNPADVALLNFGGNGEAYPRHEKSKRPRLYERADVSIKLYNINHSDFVKARLSIRDELDKNLEDAERYFSRLETADADTEHAYMRAIENLRNACNEEAPFSSFALSYLEPHSTKDSLVGVFR